jgi:ElaA protein
MQIQWQLLPSQSLSIHQLYAILALRNQVFVVEQQCAYQDIDGLDLLADTYHVLGMQNGRLLAYARLLDTEHTSSALRIGRVLVDARFRGQALGQALMQHVMQQLLQHWPDQHVYLSAQAHLQQFYAKFGFHRVTEPYLEDDIAHVGMAWSR